MIVTQTPLRVSLFGGGTDLADYYRAHGGAVLSLGITKYVHVVVKSRWDDEFVIKHWGQEHTSRVRDIRNGIVREALTLTQTTGGLDISCMSDVPAGGSGLGASSALAVGLINAVLAHQGAAPAPDPLAELACRVEIDRLHEPIGKQDQYAAAFGGIREYRFHQDGSVTADRVPLDAPLQREFERHAMLFYTGRTRRAADVLNDQKANLHRRIGHLHAIKSHVAAGRQMLEQGRFAELGELLDETWRRKRQLSTKIHDTELDRIYQRAMESGAYGGKLLGAGGGGFFLFLCPPDLQDRLRTALAGLRSADVACDLTGSTVLLNNQIRQSGGLLAI